MMLTGETKYVHGRKLYERADRLYQDDNGRVYDYVGGNLYQERLPGQWWLIRPRPMTPVERAQDEILDQVGGF